MNIHEKIARIQLHRMNELAQMPKINRVLVQCVSFKRLDLLALDPDGKVWTASVCPNWIARPAVTK